MLPESKEVLQINIVESMSTRFTCSVEVGSAGDTDFLLTQLHIEEHRLVWLGPGEVEARLNALSHSDTILEGALIEAVAGEL